MGIRVNKALGYGLAGVAVADPRVNWGCRALDGEGGEEPSGREYMTWLQRAQRRERSPGLAFSLDYLSLKEDPALRAEPLRSCLTTEGAYGPSGVLAVRPLAVARRWCRYDDGIDYAAESLRGDGVTGRCELLPGGIFPFTGLFMDARTGERLPAELTAWWRHAAALRRADAAPAGALDKLAAAMTPFATDAEAARRIAPEVPQEARDVAEFLGLFTSDRTWLQLRPVLVTWWD